MAQYALPRMLIGYGEPSSVPAFGPAVLRLAVGAVFVAHGAQKLFGLWGGPGLDGTTAFFGHVGLQPAYALAIAAGVVEFVGGLLLVVGGFTIAASVALIVDRLVDVWMVHLPHGFFLPDGYEFHLVLIAALFSLVLTGPGALSVDGRRASHAAAAAAGRARLRAGNV